MPVGEINELRDLRDFFRTVAEQADSREAVLREREEGFRNFIHQCSDGIIIINDRGIIQEWNEAEENITGISRSEAIGHPLWEVQFRLAPDENKDSTFLASAKEKIFNGLKEGPELKRVLEDEIQRPDGCRRVLQSVVFALGNGKEILAGGVSRDITERKRTEESLRQQTLELQRLTDTLMNRIKERTSELIEAQRIIAESGKRLQDLSIHVIEVQEDERRRFAGEIHDSFGGSLAAMKFKLESIAKEKITIGDLEILRNQIETLIQESKRIQMALRPLILDDVGIVAALRWFVREFSMAFPHIEVTTESPIEEYEIPDPLKTPIFRICQEAFTNASKHSVAKSILLSLVKAGSRIELTIQDDGRGFDRKGSRHALATQKGLGLLSMEERASLSGGVFTIHSEVGRGTTIKVSWPTKERY